ncbi:hypothetical protein BDF22DRAFT_675740 [Syncephalis plumigaleata]|nr:hypothetical protein BDF22DRAFT_675740 [Syncephalis plumigaleata]
MTSDVEPIVAKAEGETSVAGDIVVNADGSTSVVGASGSIKTGSHAAHQEITQAAGPAIQSSGVIGQTAAAAVSADASGAAAASGAGVQDFTEEKTDTDGGKLTIRTVINADSYIRRITKYYTKVLNGETTQWTTSDVEQLNAEGEWVAVPAGPAPDANAETTDTDGGHLTIRTVTIADTHTRRITKYFTKNLNGQISQWVTSDVEQLNAEGVWVAVPAGPAPDANAGAAATAAAANDAVQETTEETTDTDGGHLTIRTVTIADTHTRRITKYFTKNLNGQISQWVTSDVEQLNAEGVWVAVPAGPAPDANAGAAAATAAAAVVVSTDTQASAAQATAGIGEAMQENLEETVDVDGGRLVIRTVTITGATSCRITKYFTKTLNGVVSEWSTTEEQPLAQAAAAATVTVQAPAPAPVQTQAATSTTTATTVVAPVQQETSQTEVQIIEGEEDGPLVEEVIEESTDSDGTVLVVRTETVTDGDKVTVTKYFTKTTANGEKTEWQTSG